MEVDVTQRIPVPLGIALRDIPKNGCRRGLMIDQLLDSCGLAVTNQTKKDYLRAMDLIRNKWRVTLIRKQEPA